MSDPIPEMPPIGPVLRQLLAGERDGLFSNAIIARTSAMIGHLARQLALALAQALQEPEPVAFAEVQADDLAGTLGEHGDLLGHVHALAVEGVLADLLYERAALDPALSPFLKGLLASPDGEISAAAMHVLAAQARFLHFSRRMELPLGELPGELFHHALSALSAMATFDDGARDAARTMLTMQYDEASTRTSQLARLLMLTTNDAAETVSLADSGLAIFASWLAQNSGKPRDDAILAIGQRDCSGLVLMMRAAALPVAAMHQAIASLDPYGQLDEALASLAPDEARQLLGRQHGGAQA